MTVLSYFLLGVVKIIDNIILTAKSIFTYQNKRAISSALVTISQILFYTVVKQVISDNSIVTVLVVSIASGIGNYLAFPIVDRFKQDDKWYFYLTSSDKEDVEQLCKYLVDHNIKYMANLGLTRKGNDTINVTVFSKTKDESRAVEEYLKTCGAKYLKEIMT